MDPVRNQPVNDDDDDADWGWIGLLGLAGLIGLRRREPAHPHLVTRRGVPEGS